MKLFDAASTGAPAHNQDGGETRSRKFCGLSTDEVAVARVAAVGLLTEQLCRAGVALLRARLRASCARRRQAGDRLCLLVFSRSKDAGTIW